MATATDAVEADDDLRAELVITRAEGFSTKPTVGVLRRTEVGSVSWAERALAIFAGEARVESAELRITTSEETDAFLMVTRIPQVRIGRLAARQKSAAMAASV